MHHHHLLPARPEGGDATPWFRRRSFMQAASVWIAGGCAAGAHAQQRGNIISLFGDVLRNGRPLVVGDTVLTGDELTTGPGSAVVFVVGNDAFRVRENSRMTVERGGTLNTVSLLRIVSGAVTSVWGKGPRREVITPTTTAGIRGTGVFSQVLNDPDGKVRTYFCNCYGTVELEAGTDRLTSQADYHQGFWTEGTAAGASTGLLPARALFHTDGELESLAALVNQQTAWQIAGRRGVLNGMGHIDELPGAMHPADVPRPGMPPPAAPSAAAPVATPPPPPATGY